MCRVRYTLGEQRRCFPAFDGAEGLSGWSSHDIASLSALLASLSATWEIIGSGSGWEKKVKAVLQPDARKQFVAGCTPASFSKVGAPTKTQRSGFREERTSIGMSELSAQAGSEGYGDCEDEDRAQRWRLPQLPNVSCWDPTFQANKAPAAPQAVDKARNVGKREGRVCAGNPGRVPCAIQINRFQNFLKVLKS